MWAGGLLELEFVQVPNDSINHAYMMKAQEELWTLDVE